MFALSASAAHRVVNHCLAHTTGMATMATTTPHHVNVAAAIIADITSRHSFVSTNLSLHVDVSQAQADALISVISQYQGLQVDGAIQCIQAVDSGPWSTAQKTAIVTAINDAASRTSATGQPMVRPAQNCITLERYFLQDLHDYFGEDDVDLQMACRKIAIHMYKLGMVCPSNKVLKRATAIVQLGGLKAGTLSASSQATVGRKIQSMIKAMDKSQRFPLSHIREYPDDPMTLPQGHLDYAYGGKQPVAFVVDGLDEVAASAAYRRSHSGMDTTSGKRKQPSSDVDSAMAAVQHAIAPFAQVLQQALGHTGQDINLQYLQHGKPPTIPTGRELLDQSGLKSIEDKVEVEPTSADQHQKEMADTAGSTGGGLKLGSDAPTDPLSSLEEHIKQSAAARKSKNNPKDPNAKTGKTKKGTKKDGRAAVQKVLEGAKSAGSSQVLKRPAAATTRTAAVDAKKQLTVADFKYLTVCKLSETRSKGAFTSAAYHKSKVKCRQASMSQAATNALVRQVYAMASASYDKLFYYQ